MTASHVQRGQCRRSSHAPRFHVVSGPRGFWHRDFQALERVAAKSSNSWNSRSGQAILESSLVITLMSLILFGLFEISRLFMGREVLNYAATVGARAHSVGFNDFMIYKTVRIAGIPIAGKLTQPVVGLTDPNAARWQSQKPGPNWDFAVNANNPHSQQYDMVEESRIPLYLGAQVWGEQQQILNYEDWDKQFMVPSDVGQTLVNNSVRQDVGLKFPFHRAFWGAETVTEAGNATMDSHYQLYLDTSVPTP